MNPSVTVAVVGAKEIAKDLAKPGTTSDITLFNAVRDGHAATLIEPTQYPDKFAPLLYALSMADRHLVVIPSLDRTVAETAAAVDLFPAPVTIVVGSGVGEEEVRKAFKGTRLSEAPAVPLDLPNLRNLIDSWSTPPAPGPTLVRLDHAFPVKGVGAVALGVVIRGTLRAHDKLRLYPTPKVVEVRSIQVHDVDVPDAGTGERVGVALKGIEADELSRGQTLAPDGSLSESAELIGKSFTRCRYYRGSLAPGAQLHLLAGLQFVPVQAGGLNATDVELVADRLVAFQPGEAAYLADLSAAPGPRIVGRVALRTRADPG